ncbi:DUF2784 domain-containing protein [Pleionea sediminis]|uniref:DUF2784 domain-containing protein n=1 Tax=Pleionea sediminis TaxID=2569479 RepID=UPI001184A9F8|nr:DUF2784 domain-containing protein [Pleionea sediminis]
MIYSLLADSILILHTSFVVFVVVGLMLILIGGWRDWLWVRQFWFRITHLGAIAFVVVQSWLGANCPLTIWEMQLRHKAGEVTYNDSFIAHWLHKLLYYQAPDWVFVVIYTLFGLLVVLSWYWVRPVRGKSGSFDSQAKQETSESLMKN